MCFNLFISSQVFVWIWEKFHGGTVLSSVWWGEGSQGSQSGGRLPRPRISPRGHRTVTLTLSTTNCRACAVYRRRAGLHGKAGHSHTSPRGRQTSSLQGAAIGLTGLTLKPERLWLSWEYDNCSRSGCSRSGYKPGAGHWVSFLLDGWISTLTGPSLAGAPPGGSASPSGQRRTRTAQSLQVCS